MKAINALLFLRKEVIQLRVFSCFKQMKQIIQQKNHLSPSLKHFLEDAAAMMSSDFYKSKKMICHVAFNDYL